MKWNLMLIFCPLLACGCTVKHWNPFLRRNHVAALILARGGSKGIPLKNLALVGGISLIERSLNVILAADVFQSIWVSTDSKDIFDKAAKVKSLKIVNIHWRSKESATDEATSAFAVQEFINNHPEVDVVALIQCTSPFMRSRYLKQAYADIESGRQCAFSVTRSFKLRWLKSVNGNVIPLNFDPRNRPRRQDWSGEYVENGMFYFSTRAFIKKGYFQSNNCSVIIVPEELALEIDTFIDLQLANILHGELLK